MPNFKLEREAALSPVAGIDEAGRGPLAGPVYAAAVILDMDRTPRKIARAIDDSKKLTAETREELSVWILANAVTAIAQASVEEIDRFNILQASLLAMTRAVTALAVAPAFALVDGDKLPRQLACPARAVVGGDGLSLSIAAASILAKVARDRHMTELDQRYPGYGWSHNAGYGTPEHRAALLHLGATPEHRRSFSPISQLSLLTD
ncbi:MAG TPA: ribonuclease HII [Hypericibacter adhaerens]|jgi:ribonuclease HII|uniref:Ribonuclease HII n=1 Tax=Hypericibacter adhaerens TaxID=2602016 RepID=A0A5J6MTD1_9PROT|nr:ribonuclease HII [Hypericibacter adhaerens]QEX20892.1 ribonuclease HII [Hypericibacter adhaerens]HWA42641.1 ribonuclease HII [Hypericibacter adhaerens]